MDKLEELRARYLRLTAEYGEAMLDIDYMKKHAYEMKLKVLQIKQEYDEELARAQVKARPESHGQTLEEDCRS